MTLDIHYGLYGDAVASLIRNQRLTEQGAIATLELALAHDLALRDQETDSLTNLIEEWLTTEENRAQETA